MVYFYLCAHNINKTLCFYKIKKTSMMCILPFRLEQKNEPKLSEYMPHRYDKYIYRKL